MQRFLLTLVFLASITSSASQNVSTVDFVIRNLGLNVDGHFKTFSIITDINPEGKLTSLSGIITVGSIDTDIDSRDKHLLEVDYFNIDKYKFIMINSLSVTEKIDNTYSVKAKLTIKGKSKIIIIPVTLKKEIENYRITSNFEINRKHFNVGGGGFVMSKTVKLNVVHYQKL